MAPFVTSTNPTHLPQVIGVISQFDFLFKEAGPQPSLNLKSPSYREDAMKMMSNKVRFSMTPNPVTVETSCTMRDAATMMLNMVGARLSVHPQPTKPATTIRPPNDPSRPKYRG